jgi:hypothetical protein
MPCLINKLGVLQIKSRDFPSSYKLPAHTLALDTNPNFIFYELITFYFPTKKKKNIIKKIIHEEVGIL